MAVPAVYQDLPVFLWSTKGRLLVRDFKYKVLRKLSGHGRLCGVPRTASFSLEDKTLILGTCCRLQTPNPRPEERE